jgi:5-keto 4-deoxyuronate isomerase
MARKVSLGSADTANVGTTRTYVHPATCVICHLLLGITEFEEIAVSDTRPTHLHGRRREGCLHFDVASGARVLDPAGEPHVECAT